MLARRCSMVFVGITAMAMEGSSPALALMQIFRQLAGESEFPPSHAISSTTCAPTGSSSRPIALLSLYFDLVLHLPPLHPLPMCPCLPRHLPLYLCPCHPLQPPLILPFLTFLCISPAAEPPSATSLHPCPAANAKQGMVWTLIFIISFMFLRVFLFGYGLLSTLYAHMI